MKEGCRMKHSRFSAADCSAVVTTQSHKVWSSVQQVCHKPVMFPMQKHVRSFLIYCVLGFAMPAQDSLQGSPADPKCIQFSPDGADVFWRSRACTCRRPSGVLSTKSLNCAETEFPAGERGGVRVDSSVLCCQLLAVISCVCDLMPHQVKTSVASAFRTEFLEAI